MGVGDGLNPCREKTRGGEGNGREERTKAW